MFKLFKVVLLSLSLYFSSLIGSLPLLPHFSFSNAKVLASSPDDEQQNVDDVTNEVFTSASTGQARRFIGGSQLTTLLMSAVGTSLLIGCPAKGMDKWGFILATTGWLIGEYLAAKAYYRISKTRELEIERGSQEEIMATTQALGQLKGEYHSLKETFEEKLRWQQRAKTALYSTISVAAALGIFGTVASVICVSTGSATVLLQPQCAGATGMAANFMGRIFLPGNSFGENTMAQATAASTSTCPACSGFASFLIKQSSGCFLADPTGADVDFLDFSPERQLATLYGERETFTPISRSERIKSFFLELVGKVIAPTVNASSDLDGSDNVTSLISTILYSASGLALGILLLTVLKQVTDLFLSNVFKRLIVYAVVTGMMYWSIDETKRNIQAAQSNIDDINRILEALNEVGDGDVDFGGGDSPPPERLDTRADGGGFDQAETDVPVKVGCDNTSGSRPAGCPDGSVFDEIQKYDFHPDFELTPNFSAEMEAIAAGLDGLLSGGGLDAFDGALGDARLGGSAAIRDRGRRKFAELNDLLEKETGSSLVDGSRDFVNEANSAIRRVLNDRNMSLAELDAAFNLTPSLSDTDTDKDKESDGLIYPEREDSSDAQAISEQGTTQNPFGRTRSRSRDSATPSSPDALSGLGENEEFVVNDIADDGRSLFEIVSMRYLRSGYERLRSRSASSEDQKQDESEK